MISSNLGFCIHPSSSNISLCILYYLYDWSFSLFWEILFVYSVLWHGVGVFATYFDPVFQEGADTLQVQATILLKHCKSVLVLYQHEVVTLGAARVHSKLLKSPPGHPVLFFCSFSNHHILGSLYTHWRQLCCKIEKFMTFHQTWRQHQKHVNQVITYPKLYNSKPHPTWCSWPVVYVTLWFNFCVLILHLGVHT